MIFTVTVSSPRSARMRPTLERVRSRRDMARKRVIEEPTLKSWEDVNDALRQIAEAQIALGDIESDMQKQIIGAHGDLAIAQRVRMEGCLRPVRATIPRPLLSQPPALICSRAATPAPSSSGAKSTP